MSPNSKLAERLLRLFPLFGILAYVSLFCFSSTLYPGGSKADANSIGFDWVHNYWCNLLNDAAINGAPNPGKTFAVIAMIILCTSVLVFFVNFGLNFAKGKIWKRFILIGGTLSMLFAFLISTKFHDLMTILSSIFGLFALIGIMLELYQSQLTYYKIGAVVCIILLGLNNYIYYTKHFLEVLPLLQKVTFAVVLTWIVFLNLKISSMKDV